MSQPLSVDQNPSFDQRTEDADGKMKRQIEKTIQEVIEIVASWRALYNGVAIAQEDQDGAGAHYKILRFDLSTAADLVGQSRKTLDDYLLQLRDAKEYNFPFQLHRHEKMGLLRQYNKNFRKNNSKLVKRKAHSLQVESTLIEDAATQPKRQKKWLLSSVIVIILYYFILLF